MSGTKRLPGGERRKASQRKVRRAPPEAIRISWQPGDPVLWAGRAGIFRRDIGDGEHAEIAIADRTYRVRIDDLS